jgi:hypothetical protein
VSEVMLKHSRMPRKYKRATAMVSAPKPPAVIAEGLAGQEPKTILLRYLSDESTSVIAAGTLKRTGRKPRSLEPSQGRKRQKTASSLLKTHSSSPRPENS